MSSLVVGLAFALALLVPFDYEKLAPDAVAGVPLLGDLAGFVVQSVDTAGRFPMLTLNAFNMWAFAGDPNLAQTMNTGHPHWIPDSLEIAGFPAAGLGLALMLVGLLAVVAGLLRRQDDRAVVFGFVVGSWVMFGLPTRVHERYLTPGFAVAAVLAAVSLGWLVPYLIAAAANLANLHAVLASGQFGRVRSDQPREPVSLPWGDFASAERTVRVISVFQTGTAILLLAVWCWFAFRRSAPSGVDADR